MKFLSDYTQAAQTKMFKEQGVFFAFSKKQFEEGCKEIGATKDNKVTSLDNGIFCFSKNVDKVISEFERIQKEGINQDIEENGIKGIIERELSNHEAYYTRDIESTVDALEDYPGITAEEILAVFKGVRNV